MLPVEYSEKMSKVSVLEGITPDTLPDSLLCSNQPVILKNFGANWPLVIAGKESPQKAADYVRSVYSGEPVSACYGDPNINGRVYYNDTMDGFNYRGAQVDLNLVLDKLLANQLSDNPPTMYMGSTEVNRWFPSFSDTHKVNIEDANPLISMWIGNQSKIAAHYDFPHNIACSAVGKRRFTLFPPEQIKNLYVGPIEFAPGGQEISLVDFDNPDFAKYPKFKDAIDAAFIADLDAGDALFLPSMWWHHVEGIDPFNILVTHWWRDSPAFMGRPNNALLTAILSLRNLPKAQRDAWKHIFDYYIFEQQDGDQAHIPPNAQDMLKQPMDELTARKLRANLLNKLNR